jgi:hypothetical protein
MQFLYYANSSGSDESRIKASFQAATSGRDIEHYTNLTDLEERLRVIVEPNSIAVLVASDPGELQKMQDFREMVTDILVILVIPDWQDATIKLAHLLRPRFLCLLNNGSTDLRQIIAKMVQACG